MLDKILQNFFPGNEQIKVTVFGSGLINNTWLVENEGKKYILQRINKHVFKSPFSIDENIGLIGKYLSQHHPDYFFTFPVCSIAGKTLLHYEDEYYRLFDFVEGSHSFIVANDPAVAYEAAKQFGKFTKLLSGFDSTKLKITIPDFHNLSLRYRQFETSLETADKKRLESASQFIDALQAYQSIVEEFENIQHNPAFKKRVTHHDTKISNVLLDKNNRGICVIDLDTVMPGYFISDVGDMMRTYLSPSGEEETDFSKIEVRNPFFEAIVKGYLGEMYYELSAEEKNHFVYAGKFMIYMQALRFLTDYLNNDVYYGAKYEDHNLNRAANQVILLNRLAEKETAFIQLVANYIPGNN